MDSLVPLFTTTAGRIGRKQWWIGVVVLAVAGIVLSMVLSLIGLGATAYSTGWGSFIASLVLVYPSYCLSLKRRQDRDNNGLDLKVLMGASIVMNLLQAIGVGITATDVGNGILMPVPAMWLSGLMLLLGVFAIYMLVQLGFLKGTPGSNSYGPDPVDGFAAA